MILREECPANKIKAGAKVGTLNNVEVLALLIGQGEAALLKARGLLSSVGSLGNIAKCSFVELCSFGLSKSEAARVAAAFELSRRRTEDTEERPAIKSSADAAAILRPLLQDKVSEEFWILPLNVKNEVIERVCISVGGQSATVADLRVIFRECLHRRAARVVLCHNHPSGSVQPSQADTEITKNAVKAGAALGIPVLDHIIIGGAQFFSFADDGLI